MKITDYEKVTQLLANNVLLVDGDGGTKTILARDLLGALVAISSSQDYLAKMNVSQLTQVSSVSASDRILLATGGGNKGITVNDAFWGILDAVISVEQRRNIFRGKNLGTALTAAQKAEIKAGTEKLTASALKVFTKMYEQAGAAGAAGAGPMPEAGPAPEGFQGDDVVDGDYKEV